MKLYSTRSTISRKQSGKATITIVVVLGIAALIGAGAGVAWYLRSQRSRSDFIRAAESMAPESSQVFVAFDAGRLGFSEVTQKAALTALRHVKGFAEVRKEIFDKLGLDLEGDILSAVELQMSLFAAPEAGRASILSAIDKPDSAPNSAPPFRLCLFLRLKDEKKATDALAAVETRTGVPYATEKHAGVTLHLPTVPGKGPAWALDKGRLLVGAAAADLKLAIDSARIPGHSLGDNVRYRAAVAKLKQKEAFLAYVDLKGMMASEVLQKVEQKELRDLVGALQHFAAGAAVDGKDILSEGQLAVDRQAGGDLAAAILKPEHGIEMKSLSMVPADTAMFFATNLKMIWQIAYQVLGTSLEGRMMRDIPAMQLKEQGIDLQKDIIDALTGEIAFSLPDYSKQALESFDGLGEDGDAMEAIVAMQEMKMVVLLPLAKRDRIEALFAKPPAAPLLASLASDKYKGTTIRGQKDEFSFAIHGDTLMAGIKEGGQEIRRVIDGPGKASLAAAPGRARLDALLGGSKPIFVSCTNRLKATAKGLESKDPVTAKLLSLAAGTGSTWQAWTMREDGLYFYAVVTGMKL